jgi:hypothetical protein
VKLLVSISSSNISLDGKRDTPLSVEILSPSFLGQKGESAIEKGRGKEAECFPTSQRAPKMVRKLLFTNEPKDT